MMKLTTTACAVALGIAWAAAPAIAQETTKEKAERKADQIERKADQKADEIKAKADDKADKVRDKAEDKSDTVGNKMERAWDKTKAKTRDMKEGVKDTFKGDGHASGRASANVRSAQQALQDKGFNPGPIDGVMGPRTTAAVRDFQQKESLTVTGQLDAETNSRLMASGTTPPAASPATEPKETNPKRQSQ